VSGQRPVSARRSTVRSAVISSAAPEQHERAVPAVGHLDPVLGAVEGAGVGLPSGVGRGGRRDQGQAEQDED